MKVTLLKTDVAAKNKPREELRILMEAWEKKNEVTVCPGCQMTPKPAHTGGFREINDRSWKAATSKKDPDVADGRVGRPHRGEEWVDRQKYKDLMKKHGLLITDLNTRAGWGRSYAHSMLNGEFSPSPARIIRAEQLINQMIQEKTNDHRGNVAA